MNAYAPIPRPLENIQSLKGLACLLVVAYHMIGSDPGPGFPGEIHLRQLCDLLALLRMPLFAFLSGYVYSMRPAVEGQYWRFVRKKLTRLYIPLVVVGALMFVATCIGPGQRSNTDPTAALTFLIFPYLHLWFLQAIICILLIVGLADVMGLLSTPSRFAPLLLVACMIQLFGPTDIELFSIARAEYLLPFFLLGVGSHRFRAVIRWSPGMTLLAAAAFSVTFTFHAAGVFSLLGSPFVKGTAPALLFSTSGVLLLIQVMPASRFLSFFGQSSFTIYLFHIFFTEGVHAIANAARLEPSVTLLVTGVVAGVAGPMLIEFSSRWMPGFFSLGLFGSTAVRAGDKVRVTRPVNGKPAFG